MEVIELMRVWKAVTLILCGLALVFLVGAFFFVFNPLGLGPKPFELTFTDRLKGMVGKYLW